MLRKLNRTTASAPPKRPVKILQYGKGNFLRAFVEWMVDIMNEKASYDGSVRIVQVNSRENDLRFREQECLYHTIVNGVQNGSMTREIRLITSVDALINPFDDYASYLKEAENPHLEVIVSNTTEAGISFDPSDAAAPGSPKTFPGKLTALLYHRYRFFSQDATKAPIILPCELIERNGEILRECVVRYAAHWKLEEGFTRWIMEPVLFCNTLVDRIVPGFPKADADEIQKETGFEDDLMVMAEPYHLWAIEPVPATEANAKRLSMVLPLDTEGLNVKVVGDLTPYRTSKVRILNGAHTSMVPIAYLLGLRTVREAIDDPFVGNLIRGAIREEIMPTIDMPGTELHQFANDVLERFQNPFIRHELRSIALNSVTKFQVRVLPSILDYIQRRQRLPHRLLYCMAALILFYKGTWREEALPVNDTAAVTSFFKKAWSSGSISDTVGMILSNRDLWKKDLHEISGLASAVTRYVDDIEAGKPFTGAA